MIIKISENAPYFEIIPSKKVWGGAIAPPAPPVAPCLTVFADVLRDIIVRELTSASLLHYLDEYLLISPPDKEEEAMADLIKSKAV